MIPSFRARNCVAIFLTCVGMYISGVLTASHAMNSLLPCGASSGCELVAADSSSFIGPVPVAAMGLAMYFVLFVVCVVRGFGQKSSLLDTIGITSAGAGVAFSAWLTWHAHQDLGVLCPWCVGSAITIALLFCTLLLVRVRSSQNDLNWTWFDTIFTVGVAGMLLPGATLWTVSRSKKPVLHINLSKLNGAAVSELIGTGTHVRGRADGAVTIIEFGDLSCPSCRVLHHGLIKFFSRGPNAQLVFRELPLSFLPGHSLSTYAAQLAESAGDNSRFWRFLDTVYSLPEPMKLVDLRRTAQDVLGSSQVSAAALAQVQSDIKEANALGINQTPTYIILLPSGARIPATSADLSAKLLEPQVSKLLTSTG